MYIASKVYLYWVGIVITLLGCSIENNGTKSSDSHEDSTKVEVYTHSETDTIVNSNSTTDRIDAIQDRLGATDSLGFYSSETPKYKLDVSPYNQFLNTEGYLDLLGRSMTEIDAVLGESPIVVRQSIKGAPIRKEIRVYMPYQEDSTGLYIFFENERIIEFKMDEFNGIIQSGILDFLK